MNYGNSIMQDSIDPTDPDVEPFDKEQFDEQLLITREFTHVDSSDYDLHRLGYYWPVQSAAFPLVR